MVNPHTLKSPILEQLEEVLGYHQRGITTERETAMRFESLAVDPGFFDHLEIIPDPILSRLKKSAENAPAHPDDFYIVSTGCYPRGSSASMEKIVQANQDLRDRVYWGVRKLREYFFPDLPMPKFEPQRRAGVVDDVMEVLGQLVIFGKIDDGLIHEYPIQLIPPGGDEIVTTVQRYGFVRMREDLETDDWLVRREGRHGIFLGTEVRRLEDVPVGTEVWVDRSARAYIIESIDHLGKVNA